MAPTEPGWELYRSFLGVLEEGSLSGAARSLGLTQPTVGRHVAALERALGLALFTRSPTGLTPTDAAAALRPYAESLAAGAAALQRVAASQGAGVRGTVRVTASEVVGVEVLPPILTRLREAHPDLVVELAATNRVEDLLKREADIAVRMVRPSQEPLVARHVGTVEIGLHAHPEYLARHGTPRREADFAAHALVGFDHETAFIRSLAKRLPSVKRSMFAFRSDNDVAQLAAIRAGFGIGFCQVGLGRRYGLTRLHKSLAFRLEVWLTMHEDLRSSPRCRVTFDALASGLAAYVAGA